MRKVDVIIAATQWAQRWRLGTWNVEREEQNVGSVSSRCTLVFSTRSHEWRQLGDMMGCRVNFKGCNKEECSSCCSRVSYCDIGLYAIKYIWLLRYLEAEKRCFNLLLDVRSQQRTFVFH